MENMNNILSCAADVLLDDYCVSGDKKEDFFKEVIAMSNRTHIELIRGQDVSFLSEYKGTNIKGYKTENINDYIPFYFISQAGLNNFQNTNAPLSIGLLKRASLTPNLVKELKRENGLLMCCERGEFIRNEVTKNMIVSKNAIKTLCQRAGLAGTASFSDKGIFRDLHLASSIFKRNTKMKIVFREVDGINKLFAVFSSYPSVKQDIIVDVMKHPDFPFKDFVMESYKIDNFITEVVLKSPVTELSTGITPGIIITNSDVGLTSFTVKSVFFTSESYVIYSENLAKHDSRLNVTNLLKVFEEARKSLDDATFIEDMKMLQMKRLPGCGPESDEVMNLFEIGNKTSNMNGLVGIALTSLYGEYMSSFRISTASKSLEDYFYGGKSYTCFDFAEKIINASALFPELDNMTNLLFRRSAYNAPKVLLKLISEYNN